MPFIILIKKVALTKKSASDADISNFILKGFDLMDLPESWSVMHSMFMDDQNRLWLSTIVEDQAVYEWWVLSGKGKLIAKFTWPRNQELQLVKNGKVYVLKADPETHVKKVVRYEFDLTKR